MNKDKKSIEMFEGGAGGLGCGIGLLVAILTYWRGSFIGLFADEPLHQAIPEVIGFVCAMMFGVYIILGIGSIIYGMIRGALSFIKSSVLKAVVVSILAGVVVCAAYWIADFKPNTWPVERIDQYEETIDKLEEELELYRKEYGEIW